jgi:hypothetical protein
MNDISEESLQLMAEQNEKFNTRFEQNNEQERMSGTGLSVICGAEPDVVGVWGFFSSFFPFSTDSCLGLNR